MSARRLGAVGNLPMILRIFRREILCDCRNCGAVRPEDARMGIMPWARVLVVSDCVPPKEGAIATTERERDLENQAEGEVVAKREQDRD